MRYRSHRRFAFSFHVLVTTELTGTFFDGIRMSFAVWDARQRNSCAVVPEAHGSASEIALCCSREALVLMPSRGKPSGYG
jgi:hypothetical protein